MADPGAGPSEAAATGAQPTAPEMRAAEPALDDAAPVGESAASGADAGDGPPADKPDGEDASSGTDLEDEAPRRWKGKGKEREVILPRGVDPEPASDHPLPPSS